MALASDDRSLSERRQDLAAESDLTAGGRGSGVAAVEYCRRYAASADEWIQAIFLRATAGDYRDLALLAVGGYGRGELAPGSDLDLVLVHNRKGRITEVAEALWYPIWDDGVHLDHSVRTLKELRTTMDADYKVALGLLEGRLVAGDAKLAAQVTGRVLEQWKTRAGRWLPALDEATVERHDSQGDLAFLLEPDLKEARGGLRDLHQLGALARVSPVAGSVAADPRLTTAGYVLTSVRVALHHSTEKPANRLLLQEQGPVADALGYNDADALMAAVAEAGRRIAWASDDGWRRIRSALAGPRGRGGSPDRMLEPGLILRDGEVVLAPDADLSSDSSLALRSAAVSAELGHPVAPATLRRLAEEAPAAPVPWPPDLLRALLRVLGAGHAGLVALEALDQQGFLVRLLPEWAQVRNRPQRNAYHRFTVDRHLLETAANASQLVRKVIRPDLLLLGALLHDIGKGRGGDHTDIGISLVSELGPRMGLSDADTAVLVALVRHHLLLPDAATRRDLDDPATITTVADAVGDGLTLSLLAALTEADSLATGSSAWGPWKAGLVERLVALVGQRLAGDTSPPPAPTLTDKQLALLAGGRLELMATGSELTVVAPDRDGLLATIAGVLTLAGVTVRAASTRSVASTHPRTGMALLVFEVAAAFDVLPEWTEVRRDLESALEGRLPLDEKLFEREQHYARQRRATAAHHPGVVVVTDHSASESATVIEVRAPDTGPALYLIARALTSCGVAIIGARVSTLGAEVVDAFYVQAGDGTKLAEDPETTDWIEAAVLNALA